MLCTFLHCKTLQPRNPFLTVYTSARPIKKLIKYHIKITTSEQARDIGTAMFAVPSYVFDIEEFGRISLLFTHGVMRLLNFVENFLSTNYVRMLFNLGFPCTLGSWQIFILRKWKYFRIHNYQLKYRVTSLLGYILYVETTYYLLPNWRTKSIFNFNTPSSSLFYCFLINHLYIFCFADFRPYCI